MIFRTFLEHFSSLAGENLSDIMQDTEKCCSQIFLAAEEKELPYRDPVIYGKSTRMGDIDKKWALGFIDWIQHTYTGRQGKPLEQGTVVSYISQLSIALNAAVRAEWLDENPFMLLSASERVKKPESKRQFLTIGETSYRYGMPQQDCQASLPVLMLLRAAPERHGNSLLERYYLQ